MDGGSGLSSRGYTYSYIFVDRRKLLEVFISSLVKTLEAGGTFLKIKVLKLYHLYMNSGIPVLSVLVSPETAVGARSIADLRRTKSPLQCTLGYRHYNDDI